MMTEPIVAGQVYLYTGKIPPGCLGHQYLVEALAVFVPVYQNVVVVRALTGPDAGKWFVCSDNNFRTRYEATKGEASGQRESATPAKVAGIEEPRPPGTVIYGDGA